MSLATLAFLVGALPEVAGQHPKAASGGLNAWRIRLQGSGNTKRQSWSRAHARRADHARCRCTFRRRGRAAEGANAIAGALPSLRATLERAVAGRWCFVRRD